MRRSAFLMVAAVTLAVAAACDGEVAQDGSRPAAIGEKDASAEESFQVAPSAAPAPPAVGRGAVGGVQSVAVPQDPSASAVDRVDAADARAGASVVPSMLIRTGNAVVEVDSLEIAVAELRLLATRLGGYVANTSMQTGEEEMRSASIELKIPAARFDEAVQGLRPLGEVEAVNVTAEDVGEEFVDVTARMENANRLEDRLVTLLATRTGRLEDVLQVERELARVREEIERYEGRLRYLRTRAAVSTLVVTVHEPRPIVGRYEGANPIADAFRAMWRNLVTFVAGLIAALGWLIPAALVLGGVVWGLRRLGLLGGRDDGGVRLPRTARVPRGTVTRAPEETAAREVDGEE